MLFATASLTSEPARLRFVSPDMTRSIHGDVSLDVVDVQKE
jgi:hypothetical protein